MSGPLILTGAYGSGKTECALALAVRDAAAGEAVTLIDLDFVNPYFRSQDEKAALEVAGIRVLSPEARVAAIDAPSLPVATGATLLSPPGRVIVDLGGDPAGAVVIAQFADRLTEYDLWGVHNAFRPTTADPEVAAALLQEIEAVTHLDLTGLVAASHLGEFTTVDDVLAGFAQTERVAALLDVPIRLLTPPAWLVLPPLSTPMLPITPRLLRPWER